MEQDADPGPPVTIGIDGGYVRSWTDRPTNFEVIVGKSVPEEGPVRRFGFVAGHEENRSVVCMNFWSVRASR
jgi:hypothetical protein